MPPAGAKERCIAVFTAQRLHRGHSTAGPLICMTLGSDSPPTDRRFEMLSPVPMEPSADAPMSDPVRIRNLMRSGGTRCHRQPRLSIVLNGKAVLSENPAGIGSTCDSLHLLVASLISSRPFARSQLSCDVECDLTALSNGDLS